MQCYQWLEWGKQKEMIRTRKLSTNTEKIYFFPDMPSKNTQSGNDDGNLFWRKINQFCGKSIKSMWHGFVSKYIYVAKNSGKCCYNIVQMQKIRECFEKIHLSSNINVSKPFKCISINLDVDIDAKRGLKYFVREIRYLILQTFFRQI